MCYYYLRSFLFLSPSNNYFEKYQIMSALYEVNKVEERSLRARVILFPCL